MAWVLLERVQWITGPNIYINLYYDQVRSGANVNYTQKIEIEPVTGQSSQGYPIHVEYKLDDVSRQINVAKDSSPSQWSSNIVNTSNTFAINKTTGTTAITFHIYNPYISAEDKTYTYNVAVPPANPVVSNSINSTGLNNVKINWSADSACDAVQYSLNGGSWVGTSGTPYTVSGLTPNTNYTIKTRAKRTDSQLWGEASTLSFKTLDIAKISSAPDINFGDNAVVTITNPSGVKADLRIEIVGVTVVKRENIGLSTTIQFTQAELDLIYEKMTNQSITIKYVVDTYNGSVVGWNNSQDKTCTQKGNAKTLHIKVGNVDKRGLIWLAVGTVFKKAIIWVNVQNTWKRGK